VSSLAPETMLAVRDARDDDQDALVELIGRCFAEYPGCVMDIDELPELRAIASYSRAHGGRFWVVEEHGEGAPRVVACAGFTEVPGGLELKKLYVSRSARRRGLGGRLCALVEGAARERGAGFIELWSDTRFADAHRLYRGRGYRQSEETRELHDKSATVEYHFRLSIRPQGGVKA
jgi:putative acetyltransferase